MQLNAILPCINQSCGFIGTKYPQCILNAFKALSSVKTASVISEIQSLCHMLMPTNWILANTVASFHYTSGFIYLYILEHHV